jgi:hypothetical protein
METGALLLCCSHKYQARTAKASLGTHAPACRV